MAVNFIKEGGGIRKITDKKAQVGGGPEVGQEENVG
jgi:hypothetical protein